MKEVADFFRAADVMALASLAEGAAYSTLEALASGHARRRHRRWRHGRPAAGLRPADAARDPEAMAEQLLWIPQHPEEARAKALRGREHVIREWNSHKAFADLEQVLREVSREAASAPARSRG